MTRSAAALGTAFALLGGAGALLLAGGTVDAVPLRQPLETIPATIGSWRPDGVVPVDVLPPDERAPSQLRRAYRSETGPVWVEVGYYPDQGEGRRPPAADLLFPRGGWTELSTRAVRIALDGGGSIAANLIVMRRGPGQVAVLYWYQVGSRPVASDHWYRGLVLLNRAARGRADGALVRVAAPVAPGEGVEGAIARQTALVQVLYPELLRSLPP